jgi:hypothetical protein
MARTAEDELLAAERHAALREALAQLTPRDRELIASSLPTLPCPTPRSAPDWASQSAASGQPASGAWTSYAATRRSRR